MMKKMEMTSSIQTLTSIPTSYSKRNYTYEYLRTMINKSKTLTFDFSITENFLSVSEPLSPIVQLQRQDTFINEDHLEETLIGELIGCCSEALFPLNLATNQLGYLKGIHNHKDIISRWERLKVNLQLLYNNEVSHNLIHKIGDLYKDADRLLKSFQNDWFYLTFFFPLFGEYGQNRVQELEYDFPVFDDKKATYHLFLELQDIHDESEKTVVLISGNALQKDDDVIKGYFLLNENRTIHEIKLNLYISESGEEIQIKIWESVNN